MGKEFLLLWSALLLIAVGQSQGKAFTSNNALYEFGTIDGLEILGDICECASGTCTCCLHMQKVKACSIVEIMEGTDDKGKPAFTIKLTLTLNNKNLISDTFPVAEIPPLCYDSEGMGVCAKLNVRREMHNYKACVSVLFRVNKKVIHEHEMYCIAIPSSVRQYSNERLASIPLERIGDSRKPWAGVENKDMPYAWMNEGTDESAFVRIDPPHIIDPIHDYKLGRIDRNTEDEEWPEWQSYF